ncbi:glycosyltransferase [Fulvivirga imtechensis AK7]|uniref:Glycosyltransferase n=1 Tax=Fulvivirga imtechensis AK7 TaxID=1237149 RepID=L8JVT4_9BACT|nr:glycosyltransferase family 4 protein [Fulvivirga imtechensis]ELR72288.1 glycosyltransferase [Fulvivirga imtechensis AK7]
MNLIYIVEKFPSKTEYFILNEILALEKYGFSISILAFRCEQKFHPEFTHLKKKTFYHSFDNVLLGVLYYSFFHSSAFIRTIFLIFKEPNTRIFEIFVSIKNLLITCGFAYQIRKTDQDHIHSHFAFLPSKIGIFLSSLTNKPFSMTLHAQDIYCNKPYRLAYELKKSRFVITCSKYNYKHLSSLFPEHAHKIYTVYHGININRWNYRQRKSLQNKIKILSVGRLVEKKGFIYLLNAIKIIIAKGIEVSCTIVGCGPQFEELENFVEKNNLSQYINFTGTLYQQELLKHFDMADLFILPCINTNSGDIDGLPNVLLEAMASGLPIITTPVSAIPELIIHKKNGLLVRERSPEDIAHHVEELIANPSLYKEISSLGRKLLKGEFRIDCSTIKITSIYQSIYKSSFKN